MMASRVLIGAQIVWLLGTLNVVHNQVDGLVIIGSFYSNCAQALFDLAKQ